MAIRTITVRGNEILGKVCKPIKEITPRIKMLADDMADTMFEADGVGIAAPQVGVMKRLFVARPYIEEEEPKVYVMINPEILETSGDQESSEGCLSVPGYMGLVHRPVSVKIAYTDIECNRIEEVFEDYAATVICHENDHLDGILYSDKAEDMMTTEEYLERLEAMRQAEESDAEAESN